jgi:ornithine cyclodeaminase
MTALILSYSDVHAALTPEDCERAMTAALAAHARGEAYYPLRYVMRAPDAPGLMGLMPVYAAGGGTAPAAGRSPGAFGLKAVCLMRSNPARGLDTHQGIVTLFDGETGIPTAIVNASALTEIRTAAVTAAATRALAREDSHVLAILGAGVQARSHLRAFRGLRDWREVRIYAPTAEHSQAVADAAPLHTVVAPSAREAVQGADVLVVATSSSRPVFEHGWLSPGAHVNAVGASAPTAQEIDVPTVAAAALYCDSRESLRNEAAEFIRALEQGAINGEQHVRAELGEVLAGLAPGRRDDAELTLFRSLGVAVEDLAAAQLAVACARERGLGSEVEL